MFQKKNGFSKVNVADITENIFSFWTRNYKMLFFSVFFGICLWSIFVWYYSLYYFHWDAQQKQAYISTKDSQTVLNMKDFEKVLGTIDHRNEVYMKEPVSVKNIFMTDPKVK